MLCPAPNRVGAGWTSRVLLLNLAGWGSQWRLLDQIGWVLGRERVAKAAWAFRMECQRSIRHDRVHEK